MHGCPRTYCMSPCSASNPYRATIYLYWANRFRPQPALDTFLVRKGLRWPFLVPGTARSVGCSRRQITKGQPI